MGTLQTKLLSTVYCSLKLVKSERPKAMDDCDDVEDVYNNDEGDFDDEND